MKRLDMQTMAQELLLARHAECNCIEYKECARLAEKERRDLGAQDNPVSDGATVPKQVKPDMKAIPSIPKSDPNATQKAIGCITGFSGSKEERLFRKMKAEGLIKHIGLDKTGYWNNL